MEENKEKEFYWLFKSKEELLKAKDYDALDKLKQFWRTTLSPLGTYLPGEYELPHPVEQMAPIDIIREFIKGLDDAGYDGKQMFNDYLDGLGMKPIKKKKNNKNK